MGLTRLFLAQRGLCFHCQKPMLYGMRFDKMRSGNRYTREHVIPKSKGGGMGTNIVLAHITCNRKRGNSDATPEMVRRAKAIWDLAVRIPQAEVRRLTADRTVVGTYASCYKWPAAAMDARP